jgi:hypothetical protein
MRLRRSKRQPEAIGALEARIRHLESMIEGLQDAVHRESVRTDARLEELRKQVDPAQLSRTISAEQRKRGT